MAAGLKKMVIILKLYGKIRTLQAGLNRQRNLAIRRVVYQLCGKFIIGIIAPAMCGLKVQNPNRNRLVR